MQKKFNWISCFIIMFVSFYSISLGSKNIEWKFYEKKKEIDLYTKKAPDNLKKEYRGVMTINTGISLIMTVLSDVVSAPEWMNQCSDLKVLQKLNSDINILYTFSKLPWPLKNRDAVIKSTVQIINDGVFKVDIKSINDTEVQVPKGCIRMKNYSAQWILHFINKNKTKVIFQLNTDPGGSIPKFILANADKKSIVHNLIGLKRMVKKEKYKVLAKESIDKNKKYSMSVIRAVLTRRISNEKYVNILMKDKKFINYAFNSIKSDKEYKEVDNEVNNYIQKTYPNWKLK